MAKNKDFRKTTLICCIHHRRSPPFENGMRKIHGLGLHNIWILDSGKNRWGPYKGPYKVHKDIEIDSHTGGLAKFAAMEIPEEIERIMLVDNDLFIIDPKDTLEYLETFVEEQYDLASLSCFYSPEQDEDGSIIVEKDLADYNLKLTPGGIAYCIFNRKTVWDKMLSPRDQFFIHEKQSGFKLKGKAVRNFWESFVRLNPKFGVHRMDEETSTARKRFFFGYSQFEKDKWIHLGNLMSSYFSIEHGKHPRDDLRKGYFCKYFPDRYTLPEPQRTRCIDVWHEFTWGKI